MTDYLWLSILLQTLELPIGIICCCVPNLKPAAAEISNAFSGLINRLLSYFPGTESSGDYLNEPIPHDLSKDDPKARFVRLNDRSARLEMGRLPGEVLGHEGGKVLKFNEGKSVVV